MLILMPAYNEERSVAAVVTRAREAGYDVCVVDDGSADRTAQEAAMAGADVVRLPLNLGVGGALRCGFRRALDGGYDVVVQVDADGQHDPGRVAALLETMVASGADIVVGSRFAEGSEHFDVTGGRRFAMRVLARRVSRAAGQPLTDVTSGFRAIRRPLLDDFADDYPVEYLGDTVEALVLAAARGAVIAERPVGMSQREHGTGSAGVLASIWYIVRVLAAIELMHGRRRRQPPALPSDHGGKP
ncbi:glycosyltransferase family 2 protein [Paraconexibacter algicola]|nr:glycosyltransferase family 2 protein [Paraconexibacter algicola]